MHRVSHTRPAPSEFPQDRKVARVGGCSGAMYSAYPFFVQKLLNRRFRMAGVREFVCLEIIRFKIFRDVSIRYMHAAFSISSLSSQPPRLLREVCHVGPCICPFSGISYGAVCLHHFRESNMNGRISSTFENFHIFPAPTSRISQDLHRLPGFCLVFSHHLPASSARCRRKSTESAVLLSRHSESFHDRIRTGCSGMEHRCPFCAESGRVGYVFLVCPCGDFTCRETYRRADSEMRIW